MHGFGLDLRKHGTGYPVGASPSIGAQTRIGLLGLIDGTVAFSGATVGFADIATATIPNPSGQHYLSSPGANAIVPTTSGWTDQSMLIGNSDRYMAENYSLLPSSYSGFYYLRDAFTVHFVIKPTLIAEGEVRTIMVFGTDPDVDNCQWAITLRKSGGFYYVNFFIAGIGAVEVDILFNQLNQLMFTYNHSGNSHHLEGYRVDYQGQSYLTTSDYTSASSPVSPTNKQLIVGRGATYDATTHFVGIIDEIGFWNRVLGFNTMVFLNNGGVGRRYPWDGGNLLQEGNDFSYLTPDDKRLGF